MTAPRPASVVVVSRGRPAHLRKLLSALRFQTHPAFEVIVVSEPGALAGSPLAGEVKHVAFDEPNISAARNRGLAQVSTGIAAFIDDDAVPDPWWLERLAAAFDDPRVGYAGGYVRGRNGIGYQWAGLGTNRYGEDHPLGLKGLAPRILGPRNGIYPGVIGTNCAFRMDALREAGGFDEGFRYFLDETELCLRLAQAGWLCGMVPAAQVHHELAASGRRRADMVPLDLFDIGASKALFLRKHGGSEAPLAVARTVAKRRCQLMELMVAGLIEPRDVGRLLGRLKEGLASAPEPRPRRIAGRPSGAFRPFPNMPVKGAAAVAGFRWRAGDLENCAKKIRQSGNAALMLKFSFTSLYHWRRYDERGFWLQEGGLFGKSFRSDPVFRATTLARRAMLEARRISAVFPLDEVTIVKNRRNVVAVPPEYPAR